MAPRLKKTHPKYLPRKARTRAARAWLREKTDFQNLEMGFRAIITNSQLGFAYCEIVYENGKASDILYLEANQLMETLLNVSKVSGKKVTEIFPDFIQTRRHWFETFVQVATTGQPQSLERYFEALDAWITFSVICPQHNHFVIIFQQVTEQKKNADRLAYQARLLDTINDAIFATDSALRITYMNTAAEKLFGWSAAELLGANHSRLLSPDDDEIPNLAEKMQKLDELVNWRGETRLQHKDGHRIPVELSLEVLRDERGSMAGVVIMAHNLSVHRQLESSLKTSETRFRLLFENMQEGFSLNEIITNPSGQVIDFRVLEANSAFSRQMGLRPADMVGKTGREITPNITPSQIEAFGNVALTGQPLDAENYSLTTNRHLRIRAFSPQRGQFASIVEDVSQEREVEKSLRDSESKYRALFENGFYAILIFDQHTLRILDANDAFLQMYGYERRDIFNGLSLLDLSTETTDTMTNIHRALQSNSTAYLSLRYHHKNDGTELPIEMVAGAFTWRNRAVIFAIIHDITDRKNAERSLVQAHNELRTQMNKIQQLQGKLKEQAIRDPLTGLHNRRYLNETLPRELSRAEREGAPLSVIIADIDYFKKINDSYGHPFGDIVITELAQIIKNCARESDLTCRYGGEEFLLALPGVSLEDAKQRAEEIRQACAEAPLDLDIRKLSVYMSFGIATYPQHGNTAHEIIARADQALYISKNNGRNCVTAWDELQQPTTGIETSDA